ncbi:MAG: hypothetical protein P1U89_06320 [Verrucomicrobiales bacterium]|nr:hypothetical protein [Verrucomicrobiales bacterium]
MMKFTYLKLLTALGLPFSLASAVDFEKDIQPILKDHCFKCHSGPKAKAKVRYDNAKYFAEVIGNHDHAVVVPGKPDESKMLKLASLPQTATDAMPPPKARNVTPLNATEKALIRQWILEGASLEPQPEGMPASETTTTESAPDPNQIHSWTNLEGKSLQAIFVSSNGSVVTLRKEDGSEFGYPISKLNPESQKLAADLAK